MTLSPTRSSAGELGHLPWLLVLALSIHVLEEVWWFPEWATRHFGTTSTTFFLVSHVPIFAVAIWTSWQASTPRQSSVGVWMLLMFASALATNAAFHLVATFWFGEYSPGLASALICFLPLLWIVGPPSAQRLEVKSRQLAMIAGVVVSGLVAWSLMLDAPL